MRIDEIRFQRVGDMTDRATIEQHTLTIDGWDHETGFRVPQVRITEDGRVCSGAEHLRGLLNIEQDWIHDDDLDLVEQHHRVLDGLDGLLVPIGSVNPDPDNVRVHDERNMQAVRNSLATFGQHHPIVVQREGMVVRIGNARLQAAKDLGWTHVAALVVDEGRVEAMARAIADNRTGELAVWDFRLLSEQLDQLAGEGWGTDLIGFDTFSVDVEFDKQDWAMPDNLPKPEAVETPEVVEDVVPEPPEDPVARPGDLWVLGRHRIVCGDSTDAQAVQRLLDGAQPGIMVTDPPYGVEYDPAWRNEAGLGQTERLGKVENDDRVDWTAAWRLFRGAVAYVWHDDRRRHEVQSSLEAVDLELRCPIIWAKSKFPISRGHYHWQHEACLYTVRKGATAGWSGDRKQTTLWSIESSEGDVETTHGTQKPVEAMARPIRNHEHGEVYDPFLGSGTTLIAAEQLGRTCYGVELNPAYVDVAIKRWEDLTGEKAVRHEA